MIPALTHKFRTFRIFEDGYTLEVKDDQANEKPIIVTEHQFRELERRNLLRSK